MTILPHDLIVIGSGPGGYVAAIRAAQLGLKAAVVEREHVGGICLNWGCIPTKALLRSADVYRLMRHAADYGLSLEVAGFDLKRIVARSRAVADQLAGGVRHLLRKNAVTLVEGAGRLLGRGRVGVTQNGRAVAELSAPRIILATGARARSLPGVEVDGHLVWTSREALQPERVPRSLLVIGSGAIGMEFASFFNAFGAQVTVVEMLGRILPGEDEEISILARKAFERQGMVFHTGAMVEKLERHPDSVTATLRQGDQTISLTTDRVIVAVGIVGNVENLGLEETRAQVERTHVVVDEWSETGEPGLYAIGDVAGPPWLAHKASHEGVACVERIAGVPGVHPLDRARIPGCIYGHPQVASLGLSEAAAQEKGLNVTVGRFPFIGNGKAHAWGEPEGLIKTVFDTQSGALLGAHMVGAEVTELIHGFAIARTLETTETELMQTTFPHPTLSEMLHESVLAAFGRAVHL
ncbi:MAG: dihydrolipoamide dehydrogenase [Rhodospirillaceae bacterium]|nr:MAG: dihydrolipoamide dehydrogenase [Rhodospirillaceae bacterium]